jgi:hypothetical protein
MVIDNDDDTLHSEFLDYFTTSEDNFAAEEANKLTQILNTRAF